MAGIYIHIPFCSRKCIYCDFFSVGERLADWHEYIDAVIAEAQLRLSADAHYTTIYIGGGTPSLIPSAEFARLCDFLAGYSRHPQEFTLEVNPDDVTEENAMIWHDCGVNRVSMGVQSLCDDELRVIGRRHDAAGARKAYDVLKRYFGNISLDMMFGLPSQTLDTLERSLNGFLAMRPQHISAYSLMYEERTALTRMRDNGIITEASETDSVAMFELIHRKLAEAGYRRYEISNYALAGYESIHNSSYWRREPYVGLGAGAHSYDGEKRRRYNLCDIGRYIENVTHACSGDNRKWWEEESLSDTERCEEMIMTRLRTAEGLDLEIFEKEFGKERRAQLEKDAADFINRATPLLSKRKNRIALTDSGIMVSDEIISSLF